MDGLTYRGGGVIVFAGSARPAGLAVDGYPAKFTEYQLPPGVTPSDVTVGPDGAIWFANFRGFFQSTIAGGEITGTGAVTLVSEQMVPDPDHGERLLRLTAIRKESPAGLTVICGSPSRAPERSCV